MIEVKRNSGSITIKGHAGYAPHGQDIVFLPETNVAMEYDSREGGYIATISYGNFKPFVAGKTYAIVVDGERCEAVAETNNTYTYINARNSHGSVHISSHADESKYSFHYGATATILEIWEVEITINTIGPEFLPKAAAVADVTDAPTASDFNTLLAALRAAGYLAE